MTAMEMLYRKDYFRCEKMAFTLPKEPAGTGMSFREFTSNMDVGEDLAYAMCANCKHGRTIKNVTA